MKRVQLRLIAIAIFASLFAGSANATHISLDRVRVHALWTPAEPDGYLEFVDNPSADFSFGEEFIAWIDAGSVVRFPGVAAVPDAAGHDYGDRVEFDYVVDCLPVDCPDRHAPRTDDWLTWSVGTPDAPADHPGHAHLGLPSLDNDAWEGTFRAVDVFSAILPGEELRLNGALDFELRGWNNNAEVFTGGTLTDVWVDGWTGATLIDDYVSRWIFTRPTTHVFINSVGAGASGHDGFAQIDAVKAHNLAVPVPEPVTALLLGAGLASLAGTYTRRSKLARCGNTSATDHLEAAMVAANCSSSGRESARLVRV